MGKIEYKPFATNPGQPIRLRASVTPLANLKHVRITISSRGHFIGKPCLEVKSKIKPQGWALMKADTEYVAEFVGSLVRDGDGCMVEITYLASACEQAAGYGNWCDAAIATDDGYRVGYAVGPIYPRSMTDEK